MVKTEERTHRLVHKLCRLVIYCPAHIRANVGLYNVVRSHRLFNVGYIECGNTVETRAQATANVGTFSVLCRSKLAVDDVKYFAQYETALPTASQWPASLMP